MVLTFRKGEQASPRSASTVSGLGDAKGSPRNGRLGQAQLRVIGVGLDIVAGSIALAVSLLLWCRATGADPSAAAGGHLAVALASLPSWTVGMWRAGPMCGGPTASAADESRTIVRAALSGAGAVVAAAFALGADVSRSWLVLVALLWVACLGAERAVVRRQLRKLRATGRLLQRVLVVGADAEAQRLCAMLAADPALGFSPVGFADDEAILDSPILPGYPALGPVADAIGIADRMRADAVIIAPTALGPDATSRLVRQLSPTRLQVHLSSSLCDIASARLCIRALGRVPLMRVASVRRDGWAMRGKRILDITFAAALGIAVAPVLALAAAAIKLTSPGPVHFRQQRVGRHGEPFQILKLRTMVVDAESMIDSLHAQNQAAGPLFKLDRDPRIMRVGRLLRNLSIDELPQLWNVVRGDMSLVGPRPALARELHGWSPDLHGRLAMRPGITGFWQVSGAGRWRSFEEYSRCDLYYVNNWSLRADLSILARTLPTVLLRRGQT